MLGTFHLISTLVIVVIVSLLTVDTAEDTTESTTEPDSTSTTEETSDDPTEITKPSIRNGIIPRLKNISDVVDILKQKLDKALENLTNLTQRQDKALENLTDLTQRQDKALENLKDLSQRLNSISSKTDDRLNSISSKTDDNQRRLQMLEEKPLKDLKRIWPDCKQIGNSWYYRSKWMKTYFDAKKVCENFPNGHLAFIETEEEGKAIAEYMKSEIFRTYYIGALYDGPSGKWNWNFGESHNPITWTNWGSGKDNIEGREVTCPNNPANDYCITIGYWKDFYRWDDVACTNPAVYFLCEAELAL